MTQKELFERQKRNCLNHLYEKIRMIEEAEGIHILNATLRDFKDSVSLELDSGLNLAGYLVEKENWEGRDS